LVDTSLTIGNDLIAGVLRRARHRFEKDATAATTADGRGFEIARRGDDFAARSGDPG